MNNLKAWWTRKQVDVDVTLLLMLVGAVSLLLLIILVLPLLARADACLSIDVPPHAVIGQPDGDTFYVFAFYPGGRVKIRVEGINTPEKKEPKWAEAKKFTADWLARGVFHVSTCGKPTLDRIVAIVERNGKTLSHDLREAGLGK